MTVKEIIKGYLIEKGFHGLYNTSGDCACITSDLMPCDSPCCDCKPGYLTKGDWEKRFYISPEKKES